MTDSANSFLFPVDGTRFCGSGKIGMGKTRGA